jgi:hypothetical protein
MRIAVVLCLVVSACSASAEGEMLTTGTPPATTTTTTRATTTTTTLPTRQVSGRVVSDTGDPVSRAVVTMGEVNTTTGADGWYAFETVSPGPMTVTKPGWTGVEVDWDPETAFYETAITPQKIRGLRVAADAAGDDESFESLLALADDTSVNAFVFDTKQEGGDVLYETGVDAAYEIGAVKPVYDPRQRVEEAHAHGLYTVTRIVTFEDAFRAKAFPGEKLAGPWLDPASETARAYNLALAEEACAIGFDEIMFDYVRYPSGRTAEVSGQLEMTEAERVSVVTEFLAETRRLLNPMGCAVSAAVFAIVLSAPDDQGLGQRPEELSTQVDVLSPMVYPSHYSNGWLGFAEPNDHPYDVTADAISDALARMEPGAAQLRPWLQAFWWTDEQIRTSIQAAEDLDSGWTLWNVRSNFDRDAIPDDEQVATR